MTDVIAPLTGLFGLQDIKNSFFSMRGHHTTGPV